MLTKEELPDCPVATTVQLIGNKWKLLILRNLLDRPWRFNELLRSIPGISQKVLTDNLRALEKDGIINPHRVSGGAAQGGICAQRAGELPAAHPPCHAGLGRPLSAAGAGGRINQLEGSLRPNQTRRIGVPRQAPFCNQGTK